jgi:hypothetical protein
MRTWSNNLELPQLMKLYDRTLRRLKHVPAQSLAMQSEKSRTNAPDHTKDRVQVFGHQLGKAQIERVPKGDKEYVAQSPEEHRTYSKRGHQEGQDLQEPVSA